MSLILNRRALIGSSLALAAAPVWAQTPDTGLVRVSIKTSMGVITADMNVGKAPITAKNFLRYADQHRLDGSSFYRASPTPGAPETGFIQGGLQGNPAKVLKPIPHESTAKTGLSHKDGTFSMARLKPGTATADFIICIGDQPSFDADPANPDTTGYAAFGQVVDGMDVIKAIHAAPTSQHALNPVMRGEMLSPPVPILRVRRVTAA